MATIKDIAKYTGLALSTISKYLNGGTVREQNRIKIEDALKVLDYRRNEAARSLKTNKTMTIGILIPNLQSSFDTTIIAMVEKELTTAGYSVIICGYHKDSNLEAEKLKFLFNKRVDGLVIVPSGVIHQELHDFQREGRPVVLIDRPLSGFAGDTIIIDNVQAASRAVEYLLSNGHKDIGIITGTEDVYTGHMRLRGYLEAHRDAGVPVDYGLVRYGDWSMDSGCALTHELLVSNRDMSALVVCGDDMGYGAIKALQQSGVRIPEDLSLICFDIFDMAEILRPRMTTVEQPINEIGRLAAALLLQRLSQGGVQKEELHVLQAKLCKRDSVREH